MRADRLISLIMLLESRGPITAQELAAELEVSQRTIYRDIEALSVAGIPVYGVSGPDGGYQLVEGYRSYLNGLSRDEVLALLSLNIPEEFTQLAFGAKLKGAIMKIRSSYSNISTQEEEMVSRIYMDPTEWKPVPGQRNGTAQDQSAETINHLNSLHQAIADQQKLQITYRLHWAQLIEQIVEPCGLVIKENRWYLIYLYKEKVRVLDIFHITQIIAQNEVFVYPAEFQVKEFWERWCAEASQQLTSFRVLAMVPVELKNSIATYLKKGHVPFTPYPIAFHEQECCQVELFFASFEEARSKLLSFGGALQVLEPRELKYSILDYAEQIQKVYE